jgi:transcriptional repressor NrdR
MEDRVIESRQNAAGTSIRRRRECVSCSYRFTSYETIEEKQLMVVKSDGSREPFDLKKIERGVRRALWNRSVAEHTVERMMQEIEDAAAMRGKTSHEIPSKEIGEMVLDRLYTVDKVAYVRFASVYRKFTNVQEFIEEIENLTQHSEQNTP